MARLETFLACHTVCGWTIVSIYVCAILLRLLSAFDYLDPHLFVVGEMLAEAMHTFHTALGGDMPWMARAASEATEAML